jgi:hypothetical protein
MSVEAAPPAPEREVAPPVPPATVAPPAEVAASSEAEALAEPEGAEEVAEVVEPPAPPPPTVEEPAPAPVGVVGAVSIASLPFVHRGDTRTATERRIDTYGCAPDKPEHGPEVWYQLTVTEPGRVTASIREDKHDGVDVDLHLLASVEASSCIARDNERIDALVEAGTYWLVLDTFGDRLQKPGPYRLDVRIEPEG